MVNFDLYKVEFVVKSYAVNILNNLTYHPSDIHGNVSHSYLIHQTIITPQIPTRTH